MDTTPATRNRDTLPLVQYCRATRRFRLTTADGVKGSFVARHRLGRDTVTEALVHAGVLRCRPRQGWRGAWKVEFTQEERVRVVPADRIDQFIAAAARVATRAPRPAA